MWKYPFKCICRIFGHLDRWYAESLPVAYSCLYSLADEVCLCACSTWGETKCNMHRSLRVSPPRNYYGLVSFTAFVPQALKKCRLQSSSNTCARFTELNRESVNGALRQVLVSYIFARLYSFTASSGAMVLLTTKTRETYAANLRPMHVTLFYYILYRKSLGPL